MFSFRRVISCTRRWQSTLALAHVKGVMDSPLMNITIGDMMNQTVSRYADRDALVVEPQGIRWNYQELSDEI